MQNTAYLIFKGQTRKSQKMEFTQQANDIDLILISYWMMVEYW